MVSLLLLPLVSELERARTMSCSLLVCPEKALRKYRHEQKVNEQICYLMCGSKEKQLACLTDFSDGAQVGPRKKYHSSTQPGDFKICNISRGEPTSDAF